MRLRVALWAAAGLGIAVGWALYMLPGITYDAPIRILIQATCPVVLLRSYPLHLWLVLAANAATYALVGYLVEMVRQRLQATH
jgi:hypothetical protein